MSESAGDALRADMAEALARASKDLGQNLEWSEREVDIIGRAGSTADRAEELREVYAAERAGEDRATVSVKLSAELRALDRQVVDLVARVNAGLGPPKSERHQRAARARWGQAG